MQSDTLLRPANVSVSELQTHIERAAEALGRRQNADGHWRFELEADATIPAEYILLEHYLDRIDPALEARIGVYLLEIQGEHGGWPLFHGGKFDLSASVKAYFALKCLGHAPDAPHMARARAAILAAGGAERCNVFTRIQLALFGQVPWRAIPTMPVEIMRLPEWFFFHLSKISYWSRTVIVPLLVLMALRPRAINPHQVQIAELFTQPAERIRDYIRGPYRSYWGHAFKALDLCLKRGERLFPAKFRARAIEQAVAFVTERLNGEDGLGAIYPAMANSVMMFAALGYEPSHPDAALAWLSVRKLIVDDGTRAYVQPCVSPIWDTGLAGVAMAEACFGSDLPSASACRAPVEAASDWLAQRQILDVKGDWAVRRPDVAPGGWAFQYANDHYPDVDDTALVGMLLARNGDPAHDEAIARARDWIVGMQSSDGGWGAFEPENTHSYLNHIPFADHGALLDPPTADVTGRCVGFLAQIGMGAADHPVMANAIAYLRREQEKRRQLVRPLGHQLHLRHLVRHQRPERRRHASPEDPCHGPRLRTGSSPSSATMAAGARTRKATPTPPAWPLPRKHALTNRLGRAGPDGRRPAPTIPPPPAASPGSPPPKNPTANGTKPPTPPSASHGSST